MADRYDERYRGEQFRGERGYGREDRGFTDRAGDEVRSWFGDEEAERRRRMDERERERERPRERAYGREYDPGADYGRGSERGWSERGREMGAGSERWGAGDRWTGDYGRTEYEQGGAAAPGITGYRGETGYGTRYGGRYTGTPGTTGEGYRGGRYGLGSETGRRGEFTGRGPKGYQRSDARITEDVCDRLADAPDIDASNIEVKVTNGEVTLTGTVSGREDKRRTEDLIENISGVREVHNTLRVGRWQEGAMGTGAGTASGASAATTKR